MENSLSYQHQTWYLVDVQCMAVAWHALTLRSKGQVTWLSNALLACICISIGLLRFSSLPCRNVCTLHKFLADRTIGRAYGTVCRLSVTFCIVAKRCVLAKKCLKEWIGNQGQRVHFWGRRHISTSGFAATATAMAVFALFLPVQPSNQY